MQRILVAEEQPGVANLLAGALRPLVDQVDQAADGATAVALARETDYALITLDLMLPRLGGAKLCESLKAARPDSPILAITARLDLIPALLGVQHGFDEYLLKPFDIEYLRKKAHVLLDRPRRWRPPARSAGRWRTGDVTFDFETGELHIADRTIETLSRGELEVVHFLARSAGVCFSRAELLAALWGLHHPVNPRHLGVHFPRLAEKVRHPHSSQPYLVTTGGERYMFSHPQTPSADRHGEHASLDHHS